MAHPYIIEIKKYDMWYWGEPEEAKVNIKYEYDEYSRYFNRYYSD